MIEKILLLTIDVATQVMTLISILMNSFFDLILKLINNQAFIGVIIGSLITSIANLHIADKNHKNSLDLFYKREDEETKAIIKAIISEINSLAHIITKEFLPKIATDEEGLYYIYPLDTDYFAIYHANLSKIGKIKNDNLRQLIISTYSTAKFFIDCLRTNNSILEERDEFTSKNNLAKALDYHYDEEIKYAEYRLMLSKRDNIKPTLDNLLILFNALNEILQ